jgi:hypothetical protein
VNPLAGCINIPINSDDCHSFTGGFSFLNDEVSAAIVPAGFVCTFFECVPLIQVLIDKKLIPAQRCGVPQHHRH